MSSCSPVSFYGRNVYQLNIYELVPNTPNRSTHTHHVHVQLVIAQHETRSSKLRAYSNILHKYDISYFYYKAPLVTLPLVFIEKVTNIGIN